MLNEDFLSKNQQIRDSFIEASKVSIDLLSVDVSILFCLQNGTFSAVAWQGYEAVDLKIKMTEAFIDAFDGRQQPVVAVQRHTCAIQELVLLLDRIGMKTGLVTPLSVNDQVFGFWLITSHNQRVFSEQDELLFHTLADNIRLGAQKELLSVENLRRVNEAVALYEISMQISQLLDLDRVLKVIVEKTCTLLNAEISYIALADEKEKIVRVRVTHGARGDELKKVVHHYGDGIGGWVAANRTPLLVENYYKEIFPQSPRIPEILETEGIISAICVPMITLRGLVGVLYATSRREAAFNHSQLELLQALGNQAAIAIENARLYAEEKSSSEKLRTSISTHERLLSLVLGNQGVQVITDTLSELVQCPILLENNEFQILSWSSKGYRGSDQQPGLNPRNSSKELWPDIESMDWLSTLQDTKFSIRVQPPPNLPNCFPRVITPIVRGKALLGYIAAIEVEEPLNDLQRSAVEEASIIFALEFVKQETARASMLPQLIAAQEEERKRIARELHDETSQALTALMVGLDSASMDVMFEPEKAAQRLAVTKSIADGMLENIHRLISDLRPALLDDLGLMSAITWYCEQRLKVCRINYSIKSHGLEKRLSSLMEIALYRIVQEAITNVCRHAQASMVKVFLTYQRDQVTLQVEDDGRGFDPQILQSADMPVKSMGLWGILERVNILKGDFEVLTAPGKGTSLTIRVPVNEVEMVNG